MQSITRLSNHLIKNYRHFLFDFDGVIVDTEFLKYRCYQQAFKELTALQLDDLDYAWTGKTEKEVVHYWFDKLGVRPFSEQKIIDYKRAIYQSLIKNREISLIRGVAEYLQLLQLNGKNTAIVTGSSRSQVEQILLRSGINHQFSRLVTKETTALQKPDPAPYLYAIQHLGASVSDAIVFEDSLTGITAARGANLAVVGIGTSLSENELAADWYVKDFECLCFED